MPGVTPEEPPSTVLETERLRLRRLTMDDFDNLVALHRDPEVMRFVETGHPAPPQEIREELPLLIREYHDFPGFGRWAAIDKDTGGFVGWFGLRCRDDIGPANATLGYRLHRRFWGRGYATEGSRALIRRAFTELGVQRISADAMAVNHRSRRVMEKAGLSYVRTYHLHFADPIPGTEQGEVEYAITKQQWQQRKPPDDVFCMQCGPGTVLQPEPEVGLLRCGRCGSERPRPGYPLFVVTGASGAGKTTVVELLAARLPDCAVFDLDVILHVAALGWDTWRNTWLQLADALAINGYATVLCGSWLPEQLEDLPARRLVGPIHFCTLDCPDPVLADRLRRRPAWRGSHSEEFIAEHQRFAAALRSTIRPSFDTSVLSPDEIADQITCWIQPLLPTGRHDRSHPNPSG
jgi:RimJ/RimL family protein N-acetyltransferase